MNPLLSEYLRLDTTPAERASMLDAVRHRDPALVIMEFGGNVHEVTLNFETGIALIESVIDTSDAGRLELDIDTFLAHLRDARR